MKKYRYVKNKKSGSKNGIITGLTATFIFHNTLTKHRKQILEKCNNCIHHFCKKSAV